MEIPDPLEAGFAAVIFDCDGTLVDSIPAHFKALQTAMSEHGLNLTKAWFDQNHSMPADSLLRKFQAEGLGNITDLDQVLADHQRLFLDSLDLIEEISAVTALARKWAGRLPIGVASNGHRTNVEASLKSRNLLAYFDIIVTLEDVARGKPYPDLYLETARRLNVAPEHCLVFEDSDTGIQAAVAAGTTVIDIRQWHLPATSH